MKENAYIVQQLIFTQHVSLCKEINVTQKNCQILTFTSIFNRKTSKKLVTSNLIKLI